MTEERDPRCVVCDRLIEVCVCCEGEDCSEPICQPDLLRAQRASVRQPHPHGG